MVTQNVASLRQQPTVLSGQVWKGDAYGKVTIYVVTKNHVLFFPDHSVVKCRKTLAEFLREFVLVQ